MLLELRTAPCASEPITKLPFWWPLMCHCRLVGPCSLLGLLAPASRGPDSSWDSRRAVHRSPPNELNRHSPSRRELLVHQSRCSQPCPRCHEQLCLLRTVGLHLPLVLLLGSLVGFLETSDKDLKKSILVSTSHQLSCSAPVRRSCR